MKSSIFKVFCLYKRIDYIFYKDNFEMYYTINDPLNKEWFDKSSKFIKDQCARIYSEVESNHYKYDDMIFILALESLWNSSLNLKSINYKNIEDNKELFNEKQIKKDLEVLRHAQKKLNLKYPYEYFITDETGQSIVYSLIINKAISPYFYLKYINKYLTNPSIECLFLNKNKKYRKFEGTLKIVEKLLLELN
jgi:hypothetical protein